MKNYLNTIDQLSGTIRIFRTAAPETITRDHASYSQIHNALLAGESNSVIDKLMEASTRIAKSVDWSEPKLKAQGAEFKDGKLYLNGREQVGTFAERLANLAKSGLKDLSPMLKFWERMDLNPSSKSREEAFDFLQHKGLPVTPEGKVRAYKGVRADYWSCTGNKRTEVLKGKVDKSGHIFNGIGEEIEVKRSSVDDERDNQCSHGLHVGAFEYARDFSQGKLLLVEFDPKDVVSVPTDHNCQKMRVCAYTVIDEYKCDKAIVETVKDYRDEELYDQVSDLVFYLEDDLAPKSVYSSKSSIREYIKGELEDQFDEVFDEDLDNALEDFDLDSLVKEEEDSLSQVESRILDYVAKKESCTIGQIQKALNPTLVSCADIKGVCESLGLEVDTNEGGLSKWTVSA